MRQLEANG
ncbi:hypothetical protein CGLO_12380 [Colletotrichum gloeosporioides Cg-14]|uniref:Uncharacterized protein n=1 Tax=Colletotrichum gloeosporioides (strain Cg-14) TaxID=1237896 RepID=T0L9Q1_COLGC|nr:hypothetical protein CGLO_12380 [Colletotrichum gloeosporioides Cg-14]